ncbi:MAG: hypothetical protein PHX83_12975 [Acidobacteriia bacterium]|nr:hypothetical protein [Terriglobia bacterium]
MDKKTLIVKLQQIQALVQESLKEIGGRGNGRQKTSRKPAAKGASAKTLPGHILRLREEGFFKQAKTSNEVHAKLQSVYPCDANRVAMALLRLQRRKQLRKSSKVIGKKKQAAYVW